MILVKNIILNSSLNGYHEQNMKIETCFRDNDYEFYEVSKFVSSKLKFNNDNNIYCMI